MPVSTEGATAMAAVPTTPTKQQVEEPVGRVPPSIEMEPKTLTLDQIKYAREAAMYVVSTMTEEEAFRIFTAGLKPVQMTAVLKLGSVVVDSSGDDVDDLDGPDTGGGRQPPSSVDDIRDVATAPF